MAKLHKMPVNCILLFYIDLTCIIVIWLCWDIRGETLLSQLSVVV